MHRKDMEALAIRRLPAVGRSELLQTSQLVVDLQAALTELLEATRWRKTEEELPAKPNLYAVFFPNNGHRYAWWVDGSFEIDGLKVKPTHWLPIPEVSE